MGKLKEWVGSALLAQPFYIEELRMIGLVHPRGYRWRGAATQRKINI